MPGQGRMVYTAIVTDTGFRLGIAKEGEAGYYVIRKNSDAGGTFESYKAAQVVADAYNERLGVSKEDAFQVVCDTMRRQNRR